MQQNFAETFARRLERVRIEHASEGALSMATQAIIDTVGVTLVGATEPCATILRDTACAVSADGEATLIGMSGKAGILDAALINGTASHAIDFDDISGVLMGHPSVPVLPVVLALGERLGASGRDVVDAYLVGIETESRLARVVHPHHYERGWHPTATLGVFGACAAASRMLRMEASQTAIAFGLCASMASGVKENFGTMTKPLHIGHCARNGLMAALLVNKGYTASATGMDGVQGFFAAFDGRERAKVQQMFDEWGDSLEIENNLFGLKQFACCASTHNSILAMLNLRRGRSIDAGEVESIEIVTHPRRLPHTDRPFPVSPLQAKFSIQYATARALLDGSPRMGHFEGEAFEQPEIVQLLQRTRARGRAVESPQWSEWSSDVTVQMRGGEVLHGCADGFGRGLADPMSEEEMWAKFSDCAHEGLLSPQQAERAFAALGQVLNVQKIGETMRLLQV